MSTPSSLQRSARALLDRLGYDVTLRRTARSAYDPATGSAAAGADADQTVRVAMLDYNEREIDGTNIQRGDRKAIMAATDSSGAAITAPATDDQLVGEGETVSIVNVRRLRSGSLALGYVCQVRE